MKWFTLVFVFTSGLVSAQVGGYDIADICAAHQGLRWPYYLLADAEENGLEGYYLFSTDQFHLFNNGKEVPDDTSCSFIEDVFSVRHESIHLDRNSFGLVERWKMERFDSLETCVLLEGYFDGEGRFKAPGYLSPTPYVIASLVKRGVTIHSNQYCVFTVDLDDYACKHD